MRDTSHSHPFDLVRRSPAAAERETFSGWYDRARLTLRSLVTFTSMPEVVVVSKPGEMSPSIAGAITGTVGGALMLALATVLARRAGHPLDVASVLGDVLSGGRLFGTSAFVVGVAFSMFTGALIGAAFAWTTRRLRHLAPLMVFGLVLAPATWLLVHVFALGHLVPWLAHALPILPMTIAAATFGLILALELPLRTRWIG